MGIVLLNYNTEISRNVSSPRKNLRDKSISPFFNEKVSIRSNWNGYAKLMA